MRHFVAIFIVLFTFLVFTGCKTRQAPRSMMSARAPKAIGPYSHAVKTGGQVYCSGQIGLVPETGLLAGDDIASQTTQALKNLKAILEDAGSDLGHVVKVTVYLKDLNDYARVNEIYKDYFPGLKPARSAVQVARLP